MLLQNTSGQPVSRGLFYVRARRDAHGGKDLLFIPFRLSPLECLGPICHSKTTKLKVPPNFPRSAHHHRLPVRPTSTVSRHIFALIRSVSLASSVSSSAQNAPTTMPASTPQTGPRVAFVPVCVRELPRRHKQILRAQLELVVLAAELAVFFFQSLDVRWRFRAEAREFGKHGGFFFLQRADELVLLGDLSVLGARERL